MKTPPLAVSLCGLILALTSCDSATSDWNKAAQENTIAAYENFLAAHPKDQAASEARAMILQLQDNDRWAEAKNVGTTAAYQSYLEKDPHGTHALEARDTITTVERAAAWKRAQSASAAAPLQDFINKYPTGPEVALAQAELKRLTGYRVRLVSEPSDDKAQRKLKQLKVRFADQLPNLAVTSDSTGKSFSVDSVAMSEQKARSLCDAIKHEHQPCQIVST